MLSSRVVRLWWVPGLILLGLIVLPRTAAGDGAQAEICRTPKPTKVLTLRYSNPVPVDGGVDVTLPVGSSKGVSPSWVAHLLDAETSHRTPDVDVAITAVTETSSTVHLTLPPDQLREHPRITVEPPSPDVPMWKKLLPIALLLIVIAVVVNRLPRVEVGHSKEFRRRRLLNWLVLGLTYSFLYMARYNLNQFKYVGGLTEGQFGTIFGWGSGVYGLAFLLNGPLTDRWGGRTTILLAAGGAAIANLAMGYVIATGNFVGTPFQTLLVLYCANMYFQSFGAVSIVKVNGSWFHLRERGTFGGIFGILISLGLFFAYDGGKMITDALPLGTDGKIPTDQLAWLFFIPSAILVAFVAGCVLFVRDTPAKAGLADFDLGDASRPEDGRKEAALAVIWRLLRNPIILTIALIELCSGFLRQAILQWGRDFSSGVGLKGSFVIENWGVVSCIAGITGGIFAGAISDHMFQSRRGPVSAVLYSLMLAGAVVLIPLLWLAPAIGGKEPSGWLLPIPWVIAFMSMAIIGVHGMLSGTASADFGGRKNTGVAVGIIDGFVYGGSMLQSFIYGAALPEKLVICDDGSTRDNPAAREIANWTIWPYAMIPVALIGFVLARRLWNARAKPAEPKAPSD